MASCYCEIVWAIIVVVKIGVEFFGQKLPEASFYCTGIALDHWQCTLCQFGAKYSLPANVIWTELQKRYRHICWQIRLYYNFQFQRKHDTLSAGDA